MFFFSFFNFLKAESTPKSIKYDIATKTLSHQESQSAYFYQFILSVSLCFSAFVANSGLSEPTQISTYIPIHNANCVLLKYTLFHNNSILISSTKIFI